jgi:hypothetical protein
MSLHIDKVKNPSRRYNNYKTTCIECQHTNFIKITTRHKSTDRPQEKKWMTLIPHCHH